jgi:hypothetical protein
MIRRRELIAGPGSAATWPAVARAQQPERMRRIGAAQTRTARSVASTRCLPTTWYKLVGTPKRAVLAGHRPLDGTVPHDPGLRWHRRVTASGDDRIADGIHFASSSRTDRVRGP